jgi:hypothetical protein
MSGTSMATPHVAASIALLRQANPQLTADQVIDTFRQTADDLGPAGPDSRYGSGELDVFKAVESVLGAPPSTTVVKAPAALTTSGKVSFRVTGQGATAFRDRVDGGTWSAPTTSGDLSLTLRAGRHQVQVQAVAASGYLDPKGVTRTIVVDKEGPKLRVKKTVRGNRTVLVAKVENRAWKVRASAIRWSGGQRGASVVCSATCPSRVTVRDVTGSHATASVASVLRITTASKH